MTKLACLSCKRATGFQKPKYVERRLYMEFTCQYSSLRGISGVKTGAQRMLCSIPQLVCVVKMGQIIPSFGCESYEPIDAA